MPILIGISDFFFFFFFFFLHYDSICIPLNLTVAKSADVKMIKQRKKNSDVTIDEWEGLEVIFHP